MDRLATAFLDLRGMCVSTSKTEQIKRLYNDLAKFDRRPLVFEPRKPKS